MGYESVFIWPLAGCGTLANEVEGERVGELLQPTVLSATKSTLGTDVYVMDQGVHKGRHSLL